MSLPPVQLIATDLDGTLVRSDHSISERTHAALRRAHDLGVKVVLITGRPQRWARYVSEVVAADAVVIANGALALDGDLQEILISRLLDPEHAHAFGLAMRAHDPDVVFAAERPAGFHKESTYLERWPADNVVLLDFDTLFSEPSIKMLVRHEGLNADALLEMAMAVGEGHDVSLTHSSTDGLLEVSAAGVDKASTLAMLCEMWGITSDEVVAFGDMPNDAAMLQWAGRSYAMANAHPLAKSAGKAHTASNEDDGVAIVLEQLLER